MERLLEHFDLVYRYVARRISDSEQIHAIVRTIFLDASHYISIDEKNPSDRIAVSLYKIAYNHIVALKEARPHLFGPKSVMIQKAFNLLDPEDQEIIRLKFWEEVQERDIATIIGLNPRRIEVRVLQAVKRFKEQWQDNVEYPEGQYFAAISALFISAKLEQAIIPENALREAIQHEITLHPINFLDSQKQSSDFGRLSWYIPISIILGVLFFIGYQLSISSHSGNQVTPHNGKSIKPIITGIEAALPLIKRTILSTFPDTTIKTFPGKYVMPSGKNSTL